MGSLYEDKSAKSFAEKYAWNNMVTHHYIFLDIKMPIDVTIQEMQYIPTKNGISILKRTVGLPPNAF